MRQPLSISQEELAKAADNQAKSVNSSVATLDEPKSSPAGSRKNGLGNAVGAVTKSAPKNAPLATAASKVKWSVPTLEYNFSLEKATEQAFKYAQSYMNEKLDSDDMELILETADSGEIKGNVSDKKDGRIISTYDGVAMLKVYAQQYKERGIIVDGRV